MVGDVKVGVRLQGDSSGAVKALNVTQKELDQLDRKLKQTANQARQADSSFRSMATGIARAGPALAAAAAGIAALGAAALVRGIGETTRRLEEMGRTAAALGTSTDSVQELAFVFQKFNIAAEDVREHLTQLSASTSEAIAGTKSYTDAFAALGLSVSDLRGKDPAELFFLLADATRQTTDPVARLGALSTILGDDVTAQLAPALSLGSDRLREMTQRAHELGLVLSSEELTNASRIQKALQEIQAALQGTFTQAVGHNSNELANSLERLRDIVASPEFRSAVADIAATAVAFVADMAEALRDLHEAVDAIQNLDLRKASDILGRRLIDNSGPGFAFEKATGESLSDRLLGGREAAQRESVRRAQMLPPITVTGTRIAPTGTPIAPPGADSAAPHEFRPLDGFLGAVDKNVADQFLKIDQSVESIDTGLKRANETAVVFRDTAQMVGSGLASAFTSAVVGATSFSDALSGLLKDIQRIILRTLIMKAVSAGIGGLFAKGGVFDQQGLVPFAQGGVVDRPTIFPFANGAGVMGEAGPEAIMPLKRLPSGDLGVQSAGNAGVVINAPISLDLRNADKAAVPELTRVVQQLPGMMVAVITQDIARDGPISRTLRR